MSDPSVELHRAVRLAIINDPAVDTAAGGVARVYDTVPLGASLPYISIGTAQSNDDSNGCGEGFECFIDVHIWNTEGGQSTTKKIGGAVKDAAGKELVVTGFITLFGGFETARYMWEDDGLTSHGVLTFRYLLDPA